VAAGSVAVPLEEDEVGLRHDEHGVFGVGPERLRGVLRRQPESCPAGEESPQSRPTSRRRLVEFLLRPDHLRGGLVEEDCLVAHGLDVPQVWCGALGIVHFQDVC